MMGDSEKTDLPVGWVKCRLPDFTEIVMGQSPPSETYNADKIGLPFFQGKAEFGAIYPTVIKYCSLPNKIAEKGATLLSVRAPVGPTNIANLKCCIGRGLAAIHPLDAIEPAYIFYLLRSLEASISKEGTGSTFAAINKQFLEELGINLPPLPEQKRIVAKIEELFSELDKGIESFKTAREQLKVYRQALLKHAFEGKLTAQWRKANKDKLETADALLKRIQTERAERYKQQVKEWEQAVKEWEKSGKKGSKPGKPAKPKELPPLTAEELADLPQLPDGWIYTYLAELGELGRGKSKHRPRNDSKLFGGVYPFIQTGEVKAANRIIRHYSKTYSDFGLQQSKLWPIGTLCITIAANIAETAFLGFEACFPDSVVGFSGFGAIIAPEFVDFFIQSARTRIEAYAPATAQKNINLETLENLVVPYCSSEEQKQILNVLEECFYEIDNLDQTITTALQQAETLRQSILKKAFSGQLVPQDPNDEPAAVLLARIKAERAAHGKTGSASTKRSPRTKKATP